MGISGKCGFQETVESRGADVILEKYQIFARNNELIPLKMESEKDLIAYYTYGTSIIGWDDDHGVIILSDKSYIDQEEEELLDCRLEILKKYWRKCKRKKIPFDKNEALSRIVWPTDDEPQPYEIELVNRVAELGEAATGENLHDVFHDRMRKEWYELMIENGWDEKRAYAWVYGWRRFLERNKDDNNSTS